MIIEINEIELEFDIFDADNADLHEIAMQKVLDDIAEIQTQEGSFSTKIRSICKSIFQYIDDVFGENTHVELFENEVNLRKTMDVFEKISKSITAEINEYTAQTKSKLGHKSNRKTIGR